MEHLTSLSDEPIYLPSQYHHLLALYGASRCFSQDEQVYVAEQFMNEYEYKMSEVELLINSGELSIEGVNKDNSEFDGVKDVYFTKYSIGGK